MNKEYTLIVYAGGFSRNASTINEHVRSFLTFIDTSMISLNASFIFSNRYLRLIEKMNVTHIILHYSLFGYMPFSIRKELDAYLVKSKAKKIAFFQDEYINCPEKYEVINKYSVDHIFTLLEEKYHKEVIWITPVVSLLPNLTGYVDDNLIKLS